MTELKRTNVHSHIRGDLVLEGVDWDPVGAFEENWFPVDTEIKAQARGSNNWLLDELHGAKIHLRGILS